VACGETDAYAATETQPWDSAAGALLVEEAGGRVTTLAGEPLNLAQGKNSIIVSNGHIHDAVLAQIDQPAASRTD
jgi:myo-inositol-1(or 4)-monophosphatase